MKDIEHGTMYVNPDGSYRADWYIKPRQEGDYGFVWAESIELSLAVVRYMIAESACESNRGAKQSVDPIKLEETPKPEPWMVVCNKEFYVLYSDWHETVAIYNHDGRFNIMVASTQRLRLFLEANSHMGSKRLLDMVGLKASDSISWWQASSVR